VEQLLFKLHNQHASAQPASLKLLSEVVFVLSVVTICVLLLRPVKRV
jgi:hypothetical protein